MEFQVKNTSELFEALKEKGEKKIFVQKGTYEIEKTIFPRYFYSVEQRYQKKKV